MVIAVNSPTPRGEYMYYFQIEAEYHEDIIEIGCEHICNFC